MCDWEPGSWQAVSFKLEPQERDHQMWLCEYQRNDLGVLQVRYSKVADGQRLEDVVRGEWQAVPPPDQENLDHE